MVHLRKRKTAFQYFAKIDTWHHHPFSVLAPNSPRGLPTHFMVDGHIWYVLFAAVCANNVMSHYEYSVLFFSCRVCAMPQSVSFVVRFWSAFVSTTRRTGTCGQARKVGACFERFVFCDKATRNDCTLVSLCVLSPLQESAWVVHALFSLCTVCDCHRNQPE